MWQRCVFIFRLYIYSSLIWLSAVGRVRSAIITEKMPPFSIKNHYRSKNGKFAKKKVEEGKLRRLANLVPSKKKEDKSTELEAKEIVEGCRIVDIASFAKVLKCKTCNSLLDLEKIQKENHNGLLSTFLIKCEQCITMNHVRTSEMHERKGTRKLISNVNSCAVLGAVHSGAGYTALQKLFACLNMPGVTPKMYKAYEHEVGKSLEETARESCKQAVCEELQKIKKL